MQYICVAANPIALDSSPRRHSRTGEDRFRLSTRMVPFSEWHKINGIRNLSINHLISTSVSNQTIWLVLFELIQWLIKGGSMPASLHSPATCGKSNDGEACVVVIWRENNRIVWKATSATFGEWYPLLDAQRFFFFFKRPLHCARNALWKVK